MGDQDDDSISKNGKGGVQGRVDWVVDDTRSSHN